MKTLSNENVVLDSVQTSNEELTIVNEKKTLTWEEVDRRIEIKKQEIKALKALMNPGKVKKSRTEQEKIEALKLKWAQKSPLGSQLINERVTFRPFGSDVPSTGICFSLVEDKRVPTVLLKINVDGKTYHKDHKSINLEVFKLDEDGNMIEI